MAPKASSRGKYWCPKGTSRLQTVISTRSYMYTCKKHIDMLINYDAEGVILSKLNTLRKWRPRRHPRRISVPEGHLTPSTVISTRSHMYAWKKHIDILINYDAEGVILVTHRWPEMFRKGAKSVVFQWWFQWKSLVSRLTIYGLFWLAERRIYW